MNNVYSNLPALAVFSELYDNKKDVYYILWEFSKNMIGKREMHHFTPMDIKNALAEEFGFDNIPLAVYQTMLRKQKDKQIQLYTENMGEYTYIAMPALKQELEESYDHTELKEQTERFSKIVDDICLYIHSQEKWQNMPNDQIIVMLRKYLLGEQLPDDMVELISKFVFGLEGKKEDYRLVLNQIKEGFIIYEGICWNANLNELGNWKHSLTLYYDIDIIFYMAGYSGTIYKNVFDEMHALVKEINGIAAKKKLKKYIKTMYFPDVRKQIDKYFECAEQIVDNVRSLDSREKAMQYIVSCCKTRSEVQKMRTELDFMLKQNGIIEDTKSSFYNVEQYVNNIESEELIEKYTKVSEKHDRGKVERYLKRINYINMLRSGSACDKIENCKFLLITRNRLCSQIDYDRESKLQKQYSRVLTPESLTSMFWFQLNKGFGKKCFPQSLDVLSQAKIIMAHQLGKNLADCYDRLLQEREKGTITEEQALRQIADLRKISTRPEDVSLEAMAESCELKETSVAEMIEKQNRELEERKEREEFIQRIEEDNNRLIHENEVARQVAEREIAASLEKEYHIIELKGSEEQYQREIAELKQIVRQNEEEKLKKEEKKRRRKLMLSRILLCVFILATVILFYVDHVMLGAFSSAISLFGFIYNIYLIKKQ